MGASLQEKVNKLRSMGVDDRRIVGSLLKHGYRKEELIPIFRPTTPQVSTPTQTANVQPTESSLTEQGKIMREGAMVPAKSVAEAWRRTTAVPLAAVESYVQGESHLKPDVGEILTNMASAARGQRSPTSYARGIVKDIPRLPTSTAPLLSMSPMPGTDKVRIAEPHGLVAQAAGLGVKPAVSEPLDAGTYRDLSRKLPELSLEVLADPLTIGSAGLGMLAKSPAVAGKAGLIGKAVKEIIRQKIPGSKILFHQGMPGIDEGARTAFQTAESQLAAKEGIAELRRRAQEKLLAGGLGDLERERLSQLMAGGAEAYDTTTGARPLAQLSAVEQAVDRTAPSQADIAGQVASEFENASYLPTRRMAEASAAAARALTRRLLPTEQAQAALRNIASNTPSPTVTRGANEMDLLDRAQKSRQMLSASSKQAEDVGLLREGTVKSFVPPTINEAIDRLVKKFSSQMGRAPSAQETATLREQAVTNSKKFADQNTYLPRQYMFHEKGFSAKELEEAALKTRLAIYRSPTMSGEQKTKMLKDFENHLSSIRDDMASGGINSSSYSVGKPGRVKPEIFSKREDIPEIIRQNFYGESGVPTSHSVPKKQFQVDMQVAKREFQNSIVQDPNLSKYVTTRELRDANPERFADYVPVPDDPVAWGPLAGKHIHKDLYETMAVVDKPDGAAQSAWKVLLLHPFKAFHTVANPATWGANNLGNSILSDMNGFSIVDQIKFAVPAGKELQKQGAIYQEAIQNGVFKSGRGGLATEELGGGVVDHVPTGGKFGAFLHGAKKFLNPSFSIPTLKHRGMAIKSNEVAPGVREFEKVSKGVGLQKNTVDLGKGYQENESYWRFLNFYYWRMQGLQPAEAAAKSEETLFAYDKISPLVKMLRESPVGIPFGTFLVKSAQATAKTMLTDPLKITKWVAIARAMEGQAKENGNLSDLQMKAIHEQNFGPEVITPLKDKDGNAQVINTARGLPGWASFSGADSLGVGGPVIAMLEAFLWNKNKMTGMPIYDENDPYQKGRYPRLEHVAKAMLPPLAPAIGKFPGGYLTQRMTDAMKGREVSPGVRINPTALAVESILGFAPRPVSGKWAVKNFLEASERKENMNKFNLLRRYRNRTEPDPRYSTAEHDAAKAVYKNRVKQSREKLRSLNAH